MANLLLITYFFLHYISIIFLFFFCKINTKMCRMLPMLFYNMLPHTLIRASCRNGI